MNLGRALLFIAVFFPVAAHAETEMLPFGDFEKVQVRQIKESGIIGGKTKTLYEIACGDTIKENVPFVYEGATIWATSNAYAKVMGIQKGSCSVYPDSSHDGSGCLRLDTKLEEVKVLGMINLEVLVSGSIFLGDKNEPVTGTNDPYRYINMGIPFAKRPKALVLDYKCLISQDGFVMKYTGFGNGKRIDNVHDEGEFIVYLQRRWEDPDGNIYASRVATLRHRLTGDVPEWQKNARFELHYGNIENEPYYKPYMALLKDGPYKARNSKGEMKTVRETGWDDASAIPTHIILMLTTGNQGAFIGTLGNTLWIDNVRLEY